MRETSCSVEFIADDLVRLNETLAFQRYEYRRLIGESRITFAAWNVRSTSTNILEFCQIRENNYANSFPVERDQIFDLDDFRFYLGANSHGSYNLLAGSFQQPFSSLVYTTIDDSGRYAGTRLVHALSFAVLKRSVTVSIALYRITATFHVRLKLVIAVCYADILSVHAEDGTFSLRFWKKFDLGNSGTTIYRNSDNVEKVIPTRRARRI